MRISLVCVFYMQYFIKRFKRVQAPANPEAVAFRYYAFVSSCAH